MQSNRFKKSNQDANNGGKVCMSSVISTIPQIVLTVKLGLLFQWGTGAQNKRANFSFITTKLLSTSA
jgi:hypothetical protein